MAHGLHGLLCKHGLGRILLASFYDTPGSFRDIRVPVVTVISTRITRIALQTRISTDFFWPHFMKIRLVCVFQS